MKDVLIIVSCIVRFVKGTVHHVCIFTYSLFTIDFYVTSHLFHTTMYCLGEQCNRLLLQALTNALT
jgi:hypothetical protein